MFKLWNKIKNWNKKNQEEIEVANNEKKQSENQLYSTLEEMYKNGDPTAYQILDDSKYEKPSFDYEGRRSDSGFKY